MFGKVLFVVISALAIIWAVGVIRGQPAAWLYSRFLQLLLWIDRTCFRGTGQYYTNYWLGTDIPEYGEETGHNVFEFFVGFVAGQQTLLGLLTATKKYHVIASVAIGILTYLTLLGMVRALRDLQPASATKHFFNRSTIVFGRWVFGVSVLVSVSFILAAFFGLLPWQDSGRKPFEDKPIPVVTDYFGFHVPSNIAPNEAYGVNQGKLMQKWYEWVQKGVKPEKNRQLLWVQQAKAFSDNYESFIADIGIGENIKIEEAYAFLYSNESTSFHYPIYRQLAFQLDKTRTKQTNLIEVREANRGEQLIVWLLVSGEDLPTVPDDYGVTITNLESEL